MKFLADMGISMRVVEWLRSTGHDAVHLREQNLKRLSDVKIFQKAFEESRIILTFDLDFGEIMALSASGPVGIILFRLNNTSSPFVINRLSRVLPETIEALESGAIVVIEDARYRIRRFARP